MLRLSACLLLVLAAPAAAQHRLVADLVPGQFSSAPQHLVAYGGALYFVANEEAVHDPSTYVYRLWRRALGGSVERVSDLVLGRGAYSNQPPERMVVYDGALYFGADLPGTTDRELWRYTPDGGAELAADLTPGTTGYGSQIIELTVHDGALYFGAGRSLWRYTEADGAAPVPGYERRADHLVSTGADLYFGYDNSGDLWHVGPGGQAEMVADGRLAIGDAAAYDGALYVPATDVSQGRERELWRYTPAGGLERVLNVDPDPTGAPWGRWRGLTVFGGALYFSAPAQYLGSAPGTLWRYTPEDGATPVGGPGMWRDQAAVYDGALYYGGEERAVGHELWRYTPGDTPELAANVHQGASHSRPSDFAVVDGVLYFAASESATGRELYAYETAPRATSSDVGPAASRPVAAWPTPTAGRVHVRWQGLGRGPAQWSVVDALGRAHTVGGTRVAEDEVLLDLSALPAGPYWVRVGSPSGTGSAPVVVIH